MSVWQTPHASRRTSTSPAFGSARSSSWTTSGLPNFSRTAARIFMRETLSAIPFMRAFGSLQDCPTSRAERLVTMKMPILAGFTAGVIATGGTALALANSDQGTKASGDSLAVTSVSAPKDVARSVYKSAKDSVVFVSSQTAQGTATGSGFVVSSDGRIITNEHVVDGAQQVTVKIGTSGAAKTATVLAADASKDLALLKV